MGAGSALENQPPTESGLSEMDLFGRESEYPLAMSPTLNSSSHFSAAKEVG